MSVENRRRRRAWPCRPCRWPGPGLGLGSVRFDRLVGHVVRQEHHGSFVAGVTFGTVVVDQTLGRDLATFTVQL
jgi:hypothetical protein